jgi:hypothetical protein
MAVPPLHVPPEQVAPATHAFSQLPQLFASFVVLTQVLLLVQKVCPPGH